MILTADWHLVDTPSEDYRWDVFDQLINFCDKYNDYRVYILGDLSDRKDRHSSKLLHRTMAGFKRLSEYGITCTIIMGNHDMPSTGSPPYWNVLNSISPKIRYISTPTLDKDDHGILLLPFSANPHEDWEGLVG